MARSRVDPSCVVSRVARGVLALALASLGVFVPAAVAARPGNDNFADAAALEGLPISVVASNEGATREAGEPDHGLSGFDSAGRSLWWSWVAPRSGPVAVQACGTDFQPALGVYTGEALSELALLGGDNYWWGFFVPWCRVQRSARVVFFATVGEVYRIAADTELFNQPQPGQRADATVHLELHAAAIVGVRTGTGKNGAFARLVYRAAPGEENGGHVALDWDPGEGEATALPEPPRAPVAFAVSQQLVPGVGCTIPILNGSVSCAIPPGAHPAGPLVMLGDRNDFLSVDFSRSGTEIFGGRGDDAISASGDIFGGAGDDEINGRPLGRSNIRGGPGDDTIIGGLKADVIDPGPGEDSVRDSREFSGARDVIRTRDRDIDYIVCGPHGTALIDGLDGYPENCGRVERAGAARAIPAFYESGTVGIDCPPDAPRFCAGSFSVSAGAVHLHRNFRLRRGDHGSSNFESFDLGATPAQLRVLGRRPVKVTVRTRYPTGRVERVTTTFSPI
jgi:hypothetical protein